MCSSFDDPTQYDAPSPSRPRAYVLSGDAPSEPKPSVALAVLGDLLDRAERHVHDAECLPYGSLHDLTMAVIVEAYRKARDRVAAAEAGQ